MAGNEFKARGNQGDGDEVFEEIDLANEPDWAGYDESADCSVSIMDFKTQIIRSQKK